MAQFRILIAGIGNIFFGDDAFGVEVAQRLMSRPWPDGIKLDGIKVVDFGIRGLDLTYALLDGYDAAILVDAVPRGEVPGTLYVIEPEPPPPSPEGGMNPEDLIIQTHGMDPAKVLRLVAALGGSLKHILLVGCEPTPCASEDDMEMCLSAPVQAAIPQAITLIDSLVRRLLDGTYSWAAPAATLATLNGEVDHDHALTNR